MTEYHAVLRHHTGLVMTEDVPKDGIRELPEGLSHVATMRTVDSYRVFSCIMKDRVYAVFPDEWKTLTVEEGEKQVSVTPPEGSIEERKGSYVAFDVRIPLMKAGDTQLIHITGVRKRGPSRHHGDLDNQNWRNRWLEHFDCEPPVPEDESLVYEIYTEETPQTNISFSS